MTFVAGGVPPSMVEPAMSPCAGAVLFGSDIALTGSAEDINRLVMAGLRNEQVLLRAMRTGATCAGRDIFRLTEVTPTGTIAPPPAPTTAAGMGVIGIVGPVPSAMVEPPTSPCAGAVLLGDDTALTGTPDVINRLIMAGMMRRPVSILGMDLGTRCAGRHLVRVLSVL